MTHNLVVADPPREGLVFSRLAETSPLDPAEAAELYGAAFQDLLVAAVGSGGDVLVNYRPADLLPEAHRADADPGEELRDLAAEVLAPDDLADVRFEVQVGSTRDARVGNAVTHLLEREDETSVAVLEPGAPTLARKDLDGAAMKLRQRDVVLGPGTGGRVAYAGFGATVDFAGAYTPPELETLTDRALDAGLDVDFIDEHVTLHAGDDLLTLLAHLRARRRAGRIVPERTTACLEGFDLRVRERDGERALVRG